MFSRLSRNISQMAPVARTAMLVTPRVAKMPTRNFITVIHQGSMGVRTSLGKFDCVLEPGLRLCIPIYHDVTHVDMRERIESLSKQHIVSYDAVTITVDASVQYKIVDAKQAILNIKDVRSAIVERCQMQLRTVLSTLSVNDILHQRDIISNKVINELKQIEKEWGVQISSVQIKDISFDESLKKSMSLVAEGERNNLVKQLNARADVEAAKIYAEASKIYTENPISLRLREFQLWQNVSNNPNTTIYVVPSNICDFMGTFKNNENNK